MTRRTSRALILSTLLLWTVDHGPSTAAAAPPDFPLVPDDLEVSLFARDPLVRNPCAITFDAKGRLCVGMGPQYRNPEPGTEGDSVYILADDDGDGSADRRIEFARGLNSIQGLAWNGSRLWIANSPDLTVVRDLDGDDKADEYVRLYTDLGNLEHALHGLNFGPDGLLYMSKGNSSGLVDPPDRAPPKPFRELWGIEAPDGTPDFPAPVKFTAETYEKTYHDPRDYWGLSGGILRCNPDGANLKIVARGFRNPWDICFDDGFHWLGTDNDQTLGDKIFSPFYGAHFGWGHPWSYDWKGDDHLPSAPSAGPLFEGSGAGVIYCGIPTWPEKYRGAFFINDWLKREVYIYRPEWKGASMQSRDETLDVLAHAEGGRSAGNSQGRSFDPVDIELGPDGAIYISSWGREYGAKIIEGKLANEGRIYRIRPKEMPAGDWREDKREHAIGEWSFPQLIDDLGTHLPAWRTTAQEEFVRRGDSEGLVQLLKRNDLHKSLETWALWTLARIAPDQAWFTGNLNRHIQSLRVQGLAARLRDEVRTALGNPEPRLRHEAILAIHQAGDTRWTDDLIDLLATETDRIVYYSTWKALTDLLPTGKRKELLAEDRPAVRRGILLSLLEEDALSDDDLRPLARDSDARFAALATKRLGGKAETALRGSKKWTIRPRETSPARPLSVVSAIKSESGKRYYEATLTRNTRAYSDRKFVFKSIPGELEGETFIQGANNDADPASGTALFLAFRDPTTVYLADDVRGDKLPAWARDKFEATGMFLETTDAKHRLYKGEFAAGEAEFGPNRAGVRGRKGNFILILQPNLFNPPARPTTAEDVLPLLADADPERGRTLFLSRRGAACATCHRLDGIGNIHAPDLAGIGARADAAFIIQSILDPSAAITEGFVNHVVTTKEGTLHGGIILEETGRSVKLALMGGATVTLDTADIAKREATELSAMPAIFPAMLRPRDVADITAWLLNTPAPVLKEPPKKQDPP